MLELHKKKQRMEVSEDDYNAQVQEQSKLMKELESQRDKVEDTAIKYAEVRTWLTAFESSMENGTIMTAEDGSIMKTLVEKIIVRYTGIEIHFKCGVSVGQEYTLTMSGCGSLTEYDYNDANLVSSMTNYVDSVVVSEFSYNYYTDGNQRVKTDTVNDTATTYVYDGAGRLVSETEIDTTLLTIRRHFTTG